jgi:hypothetical protein
MQNIFYFIFPKYRNEYFKFYYIYYYFNIFFYNKISVEYKLNEFNLYDPKMKNYKLSTFLSASKDSPRGLVFTRNFADFFNTTGIDFNSSLQIKDNNILIYFEFFKSNLVFCDIFKFDDYFKNTDLDVCLIDDYIFKVELTYFIIYRDYVEYFRKYKYNEYLAIHPVLSNSPDMKILLR